MQQTSTTLRRKEHIPQRDRTDDRDRAADEIETWVSEHGWPLQTSSMAEWGEYSRQHYSNTLNAYYETVEVSETRTDGGFRGRMDITVPDDVNDPKTFLRGVIHGLEEATRG